MRLLQRARQRCSAAMLRDIARQLGVALVAAGIIGYFIAPATTAWAVVPVGIGLVLLERAAKRWKED